jgi:hypothetical protein
MKILMQISNLETLALCIIGFALFVLGAAAMLLFVYLIKHD